MGIDENVKWEPEWIDIGANLGKMRFWGCKVQCISSNECINNKKCNLLQTDNFQKRVISFSGAEWNNQQEIKKCFTLVRMR